MHSQHRPTTAHLTALTGAILALTTTAAGCASTPTRTATSSAGTHTNTTQAQLLNRTPATTPSPATVATDFLKLIYTWHQTEPKGFTKLLQQRLSPYAITSVVAQITTSLSPDPAVYRIINLVPDSVSLKTSTSAQSPADTKSYGYKITLTGSQANGANPGTYAATGGVSLRLITNKWKVVAAGGDVAFRQNSLQHDPALYDFGTLPGTPPIITKFTGTYEGSTGGSGDATINSTGHGVFTYPDNFAPGCPKPECSDAGAPRASINFTISNVTTDGPQAYKGTATLGAESDSAHAYLGKTGSKISIVLSAYGGLFLGELATYKPGTPQKGSGDVLCNGTAVCSSSYY